MDVSKTNKKNRLISKGITNIYLYSSYWEKVDYVLNASIFQV